MAIWNCCGRSLLGTESEARLSHLQQGQTVGGAEPGLLLQEEFSMM